MSALVASFSRLLDANPHRRLIHLPAHGHSHTTRDVWDMRASHVSALHAHGLRPGDLLLVAVGNGPACVSLFLAALELHLAIFAVDSATTPVEVRGLCVRFGAVAIVAAAEHASGLGRPLTALAGGAALIEPDASPSSPARYANVALLKLTSGSTGLPKATRTTEAQLIVDSQQITQAMGIGPDDTQIAAIPLSHAYGASVILAPLLIQGTPIVLRESFVPHQLPSDAATYLARTFPGVPFMFEYFLNHPPADGWPPTLRTLMSAGARLPSSTVQGFLERFGRKVHSFYGTTESGGISYDGSDDLSGLDTVGWPLPGVTIAFQADDAAPPGTGRIHVRSGGVSDGYVGEDGGEFRDDGFLTGDYGRLDAEGRLVLTGRASSFINVAGKKVQPAEIEAVLRQMPGVRDARVLAAADPRRGEQVAACIVPDGTGAAPTPLAVRRFCSARLASFKIPRVVVTLDAVPLTARGKVDRRALDEAVSAAIAGFPEPPC